MTKKPRKRPPDELRIIEKKKLDEMESKGLTAQQRKTWDRKPYDTGGKK